MKCRFCDKNGKHWDYKICPECLNTSKARRFIKARRKQKGGE